jgi:hypothetical protein
MVLASMGTSPISGGKRMIHDAHQKVTSTHLKRSAYLYIRQSTIRQVFENTESTQRQYALQQNAIALGWPQERIIIIDSDLGNPVHRQSTGKGFSGSWRRSEWDEPASYSV